MISGKIRRLSATQCWGLYENSGLLRVEMTLLTSLVVLCRADTGLSHVFSQWQQLQWESWGTNCNASETHEFLSLPAVWLTNGWKRFAGIVKIMRKEKHSLSSFRRTTCRTDQAASEFNFTSVWLLNGRFSSYRRPSSKCLLISITIFYQTYFLL